MSKSDPNSAIFMEDSAAEVKTKIKKAFCPPEQASDTSVGRMWQLTNKAAVQTDVTRDCTHACEHEIQFHAYTSSTVLA